MIDSISKRYSACGARIGSVDCKNKYFNKQILKLYQSRLPVTTLEQVGAASLYNINDINLEYKKRRDLIVKRLESMPGVMCNNPEGAFYIIAKLPVQNAEEFCIWLLQEFHYNNETIMLCPTKDFYQSNDLGIDEVRITCVLKEEDLNKSMNILEMALQSYKYKR